MKIKLDENISRHLKLVIIPKGHECVTAEDEGLLSKTDVEVGAAAKSEGRMLFTLDLEFANLHKFPPGSHLGVVLFRPQSMGPLAVNRFITQFIERRQIFPPCLAVLLSSIQCESVSDARERAKENHWGRIIGDIS